MPIALCRVRHVSVLQGTHLICARHWAENLIAINGSGIEIQIIKEGNFQGKIVLIELKRLYMVKRHHPLPFFSSAMYEYGNND